MSANANQAPHPLDPLTAAEITLSSKLIKTEHPAPWIFNSITLLEPSKHLILEYNKTGAGLNGNQLPIPRKSFVILIERGSGCVHEAMVDLTAGRVEKLEAVPPGSQPTLTPDDCFDSERIVKADAGVQKRCRELGYENMELIVADPWSFGFSGEVELENKRLVQLFMYVREFECDNHYAHPLNFVTVVDLTAEKVIRIDDLPTSANGFAISSKKPSIPRRSINHDVDFLDKGTLRSDLKPLDIVQPDGPSFTVEGNEIRWQKFRLRISFNYREGLVLHNVQYQDGDRVRDLLYRASMVEMVVPYGDPRPPFHRKSAFDVGDYGLGFCANSLELGCDCLGTIQYFDAILNNHEGEPTFIKNAICLHEEDTGLLFKHVEYRNPAQTSVGRARRLVLSFIVTVVNYEYAFYWTFNQDGSIGFEIKPTGELSTNFIGALDSSESDIDTGRRYGTVVAPGINAQFHQHIFAVRLDPMFDGPKNSIAAVDVKPLPERFGSAENPYGQGFVLEEQVFKTTNDVGKNCAGSSNSFWKIFNLASIHEVTREPCAWKLIPLSRQTLMAQEGSYIRNRAQFATRPLWVTKYNEAERFPAGFYVNQCKGEAGIHKWTEEAKSIENEDIVLWHTLGVAHIPRVEDFPIMNVDSCGFVLKPHNFFDSNPALDVPRPKKKQCH